LILHASRDELRLEGRYDIRTFRGPVRELVLHWPGWRTEGWKLEGIQPAGTVVTGITTDDTTDNGRLLVGIADQAPANFELRVMARCPTPKTAEARLALPRLLGPTTWATQVLFLHAENIDADLLPMGETALRPIEADGGTTAESLGFDAALAVRHYRLDTEERLIAIQVTPRTQRVSVASSTAAEIRGRRLRVEQSLRHRVEYERLGELNLQVPTSLAAGVAFRLGTTTLTPTWSDGDRPRERIAKLKLPQALLGEVTIVATWEQPLPDELWIDRDATIAIPLLTSRSGTFTTNELTMTPPAWFTVSAVDAGWQRSGGDRSLVWSAGGEVTTFDGLLSPGTGAEGEPFLASRALVALSADPQGQQTYVVSVRVSGSGAHLNVQLPATATPGRFFWDGRLLDESEILEFPLGSRRYTLPWSEPQTADQERLLRVEYAVPGTGLTGISSLLATQVPKIPQCRWTDRVVWWVDIPASQHLFGPPLNVTPLYAWTRSGFVWRREPLVTRAAMTEWLAGTSSTGEQATAAWPRLGNDYAFTQFGPLEDVRLRLMSSAMGFLWGAGGALGLGFLLIKVRVFRSLISLLSLCCGAMVSALWFLPQMELLFQPMLVGGGLAALLGWHEAWSRRHSAGTLLNLSVSPGDWQTATVPDPSAPPASLLIRGTDSATIYREPASDDTRSRHPMESHVG
jgi:hypothetical protein